MSVVEQVDGERVQWRRVMGRSVAAGAAAALAVTAVTVHAGAATAAAAPAAALTGGEVAGGEVAVPSAKYHFAAGLLGGNEVAEPGKKVDDRDGVAIAKFRIQGDRFHYFVQWKKTGKPSAFHVHKGKAGKNGPVVIDLLSNGRIRGNTSFGSVLVKDSGLLKGIKNNPKNWYANMHTTQFPDGAVRGQLHKGGHW